jgi:hypothetical protein
MHVLWFDELYTGHADYQFRTVERAAERDARLVLFAGTSFAVGVTSLVLDGATCRRIPVFNIDPTPRVSAPSVHSIAAPAEVALAQLCEALGVEIGPGEGEPDR